MLEAVLQSRVPFRDLSKTLSMLAVFLAALLIAGCRTPAPSTHALHRIAFGSCMNTNRHPMFQQVLGMDFDLMVLLGDNIYADTTNMMVMQRKYQSFKSSEFWQGLRKKAPVLATWDDHDMGGNDAGKDYPFRDDSQKLFLEFLDEPANSARWKRPGVYDSTVIGPPGKRVQIILLDTRYFRDRPATGENHVEPSGGKYIPHPDTNTTILGETQWKWLEEQLRVPAEVRIIGSSIQLGVGEFSAREETHARAPAKDAREWRCLH
jgi:alkaline phosphatase D